MAMQGFDAANPPFDRLTHQEMEEIQVSLDVAYFSPGEIIVRQASASKHLHVVLKGLVESRGVQGVQAVLGPKDSFDSRALVHESAGENFVAVEETLCFMVPRDVILRLIRRNPAFAAFFYADVSRKLDAFAEARKAEGVDSVLRSRVREARYGRAVFIDGDATIEQAGHSMRDNDINALFIRDGDRIGVVTGMNLSKAVVLNRLPLHTTVKDICHYDVISIDANDFIFEALLLMTRHNKRRIAVRSGDLYLGFLEDIDLLGLFAGNSQLIPGRIDRARNVDDLAAAASDIHDQVQRLHRQGLKVDLIAAITSDLNRRLFRKLFDMTAPPSVQAHGALLLMGSEGRGEQTVRTDQDNALLLSEPVPDMDLAAFRRAFSGALRNFGFPECPGNVMVGNSIWSQPVDKFIDQLRLWVFERNAETAMNIAIFSDAITVAGDPNLLARAKDALVKLMRGERALLAQFAHLIESFTTPNLSVFSQLMTTVGVGSNELDLKKSGIFPIVHGIRTLAIDNMIVTSSTEERILLLVEAGVLNREQGDEISSALKVFLEFRLRSQLQAAHRGRMHQEAILKLNEVTASDRDILRDALRITRQLREIIRMRYNLAAF